MNRMVLQVRAGCRLCQPDDAIPRAPRPRGLHLPPLHLGQPERAVRWAVLRVGMGGRRAGGGRGIQRAALSESYQMHLQAATLPSVGWAAAAAFSCLNPPPRRPHWLPASQAGPSPWRLGSWRRCFRASTEHWTRRKRVGGWMGGGCSVVRHAAFCWLSHVVLRHALPCHAKLCCHECLDWV